MSLDTKPDHDIELRFLEDLFEDDCKCESDHLPPVSVCSGDVIARKRTACIRLDFKICRNSYEHNMRSVTSGYRTCASCGRLTSECFTITLI